MLRLRTILLASLHGVKNDYGYKNEGQLVFP